MARYIAFLRAINVGGHVVKMDKLRGLFEDLGFSQVETFIQSGNVIFDSPARKGSALESKIEQHLQQALGYEVITFVRTVPELIVVAQLDPFKGADSDPEATLYAAFLKQAPGQEAQRKLLSLKTEYDDFYVYQREAYWLRRQREGSVFSGAFLEKALSAPATMRNLTTVRKIVAKYPAQGKNP